MRLWQLHFSMGLICLVIGATLFLLPLSGSISSLDLGVLLYLLGTFVAGVGVGVLASSSTIYRIERENEIKE
jgi:hypothetical protein